MRWALASLLCLGAGAVRRSPAFAVGSAEPRPPALHRHACTAPRAPLTMSASPPEEGLAVRPLPASAPAPQSLPPATSSVAGAAALVAGTTVGAGILALPAKTLAAGFWPSTGALFLAWLYMAASGILIAEVNVNTLCGLGRNSVSIRSMASETLGDAAAAISGAVYVFIHYALLVAYILQGGAIASELLHLPAAWGAGGFAAAVGGGMLIGTAQQIERLNGALVVGVVATFAALVVAGLPLIQPALLAHASPAEVLPSVPVLVLALVFHNVVPTICYGLGCDLPKIRSAIIFGSALPFAMFVAWDAVILGSTPWEAAAMAGATGEIFDPLLELRNSGGAFAELVRAFSLLAIVTSFIGFTFGLSDYWADVLGWDAPDATPSEGCEGAELGEAAERPLGQKGALYALALSPPLAVACSDPTLFFAAIDNAGAFGILTLFGIFPAAMAWQQRYGPEASPAMEPALPGGRLTLATMGALAAGIVGVQAWERLSLLLASELSW